MSFENPNYYTLTLRSPVKYRNDVPQAGAAADITLPSIAVPSMPGTIMRATFKLAIPRAYWAGAGEISSDQEIQAKVGVAAYTKVIDVLQHTLYNAGAALNSSSKYEIGGIIDGAALFTWGDTVDLKWALAENTQVASVIQIVDYYLELFILVKL
jgi:hypothetical protein